MFVFTSARQQAGFTLQESLAVLVLTGLLSAAAIPHILDLRDGATHHNLVASASSFQSAARLYRLKWLSNGQNTRVPGFRAQANHRGFPSGYQSSGLRSDSDCQLIWDELIETNTEFDYDSLSQNSGLSDRELANLKMLNQANYRWRASASSSTYCRFSFIEANEDPSSYFLFDTLSGQTYIFDS